MHDLLNRKVRIFHMIRHGDESGVSGVGLVLDGVVFRDGTCVVRWCTKKAPSSTAIYRSYREFRDIHIDRHPTNKTQIVWEKEQDSR